jgi:hypothetical protein
MSDEPVGAESYADLAGNAHGGSDASRSSSTRSEGGRHQPVAADTQCS